jgi:hypothetical protein
MPYLHLTQTLQVCVNALPTHLSFRPLKIIHHGDTEGTEFWFLRVLSVGSVVDFHPYGWAAGPSNGYGPNAASEQPGRQRQQVFAKRWEAAHRVRVPVRRYRDVDFRDSNIDPGCIRLDTFQTGNGSASASAFVSHRSSLLCHRTGQIVRQSNLPNEIDALAADAIINVSITQLGTMLGNGLSESAKVSDGLLPAPWGHHFTGYHRILFIPVSTCPSRSVARDDILRKTRSGMTVCKKTCPG